MTEGLLSFYAQTSQWDSGVASVCIEKKNYA